VLLASCSEESDGPPDVVYASSVCAECDMIISDERFCGATIVEDERGRPVALLFDDYNCQAAHEASLGSPVIARWVHDHATRRWVRAEGAHFTHAMSLYTPMASHLAAFETEADAQALADRLGGRTLGFDEAWALGATRHGAEPQSTLQPTGDSP
jgi:nitrous oxide reductase accessory protein NosL